MSTKVVSESGELLWSPNDFGSYSTEKIEIVSKILKNLLSELTISMETKVDESSLVNVYTKKQSDDKFMEKSSINAVIESLVKGEISAYIASGDIVSSSAIDTVNVRLLALYQVCFGTNFDGSQAQVNSFNSQLSSLDLRLKSNENSIEKMRAVIYKTNPDGSYSSDIKLVQASVVGDLSDISSSVSDRTSIVKAINSLANKIESGDISSDVSNIKKEIGTANLDTDDKTLKGAINEVKNDVFSLKNSVSDLGTSLGDVSSLDASDIISAINTLVSKINDLETRVEALETS